MIVDKLDLWMWLTKYSTLCILGTWRTLCTGRWTYLWKYSICVMGTWRCFLHWHPSETINHLILRRLTNFRETWMWLPIYLYLRMDMVMVVIVLDLWYFHSTLHLLDERGLDAAPNQALRLLHGCTGSVALLAFFALSLGHIRPALRTGTCVIWSCKIVYCCTTLQ